MLKKREKLTLYWRIIVACWLTEPLKRATHNSSHFRGENLNFSVFSTVWPAIFGWNTPQRYGSPNFNSRNVVDRAGTVSIIWARLPSKTWAGLKTVTLFRHFDQEISWLGSKFAPWDVPLVGTFKAIFFGALFFECPNIKALWIRAPWLSEKKTHHKNCVKIAEESISGVYKCPQSIWILVFWNCAGCMQSAQFLGTIMCGPL